MVLRTISLKQNSREIKMKIQSISSLALKLTEDLPFYITQIAAVLLLIKFNGQYELAKEKAIKLYS